MFDFRRIGEYKESDRLEAKLAMGGLPESIWETYSAFANTQGGVILLGVEERFPERTLHPVDLPYPEEMAEEFLTLLSDPKKASVNILSQEDVTVEVVDGKHIIVIRVPMAPLPLKPVYIGGSALNGSYYRYGDGDYRFTEEEVRTMQTMAGVVRSVE